MSRQLSRETRISLVLGIGIIVAFAVVLTQLKPGAPREARGADEFTRYSLSPATDQPLPDIAPPRRDVAPPAPSRRTDGNGLASNRQPSRVARGRTYTVKPNDSLTKIALREYGPGNAQHYKLIYEANRAILPSERALKPGQILVIPSLSAAGTLATARRTSRSERSVAYTSDPR